MTTADGTVRLAGSLPKDVDVNGLIREYASLVKLGVGEEIIVIAKVQISQMLDDVDKGEIPKLTVKAIERGDQTDAMKLDTLRANRTGKKPLF